MALYRQNRQRKKSIAENIADMLYRDIARFGDDDQSIYRQSEEEIMLWYLAGYHSLTPETTIAEYAEGVSAKTIPGLITLSTSIHKTFKEYARDLFKKRGWEKHTLEVDATMITRTLDEAQTGENDHAALLRYYRLAHGIGDEEPLFGTLLRPAGAREIPSIHVARLRLMRERKKRTKMT